MFRKTAIASAPAAGLAGGVVGTGTTPPAYRHRRDHHPAADSAAPVDPHWAGIDRPHHFIVNLTTKKEKDLGVGYGGIWTVSS